MLVIPLTSFSALSTFLTLQVYSLALSSACLTPEGYLPMLFVRQLPAPQGTVLPNE